MPVPVDETDALSWTAELWPSPHHRDEARSAVDELLAAAAASPGLVSLARADSDSGDALPSVTLRLGFRAEDVRDAWQERAAQLLHGQGEAWHRAPEVRMSAEAVPEGVVEVIAADVDAAHAAEYEALRAEVTRRVVRAPGFTSISTVPPASGDDRWLTEITFADATSLTAWQADPDRQALVARLRALAPDETRLLPAGFGRWVSIADGAIATTPTWKSAMVVVAVLYPLVSILDITMGNFLANELGWVLPQQAFLGNVVGTILLTWLLMPLATRAARRFLDPGASPATTRTGVIALLAIYVAEVAIFWWIYATFNV